MNLHVFSHLANLHEEFDRIVLGVHIRTAHLSQKFSQDLLILEDVRHDVLGVHVDERIDVLQNWILNESRYSCIFKVMKSVN